MNNDIELGNGVYKLQFHQLENWVMVEINDPVNFMTIKITPDEIELLKTYLDTVQFKTSLETVH
jgi:hypothetical protein